MADASNLRSAGLINKTVTGEGAVDQGDSRLNATTAREHMPHVSIPNDMTEHVTSFPSKAKSGRGAKSQAGT